MKENYIKEVHQEDKVNNTLDKISFQLEQLNKNLDDFTKNSMTKESLTKEFYKTKYELIVWIAGLAITSIVSIVGILRFLSI